MANRRLFQFSYTYEREVVRLFANIAIGASGAPTLESAAKGIASVTRNSAGDYSIALTDNFNKLLAMHAVVQNATGIPAAPDVGLKTDSVSSSTAPLIRIVTSAAGVATDPASGDTIRLEIVCRNAST